MRLPRFLRRPVEHRQTAPYTDAIVAQILAATGRSEDADIQATAALEIAAGTLSRAFASADVDGADIPPGQLSALARSMLVRGEALAYYNGIQLIEVVTFDIYGGANRNEWRYSCEIDTPGGRVMNIVTDASWMVHWQYSYDLSHPWRGIGPMQRAIAGGRLAAEVEKSMSDEAGGTVGYLLPIPTDADDTSVTALKADLKNLRGRTSIVETTSGGWGEGRIAAPRSDYQPQRIGPNFPPSVAQVHHAIQNAVLAACGVPTELVDARDGTSAREAWRRFLHGTVAPMAHVLASELTRVYARPVKIGFERLFASDLMGRARAFQSMVGGGMDIGKAAALSGLLAEE